MKAKYYVVPAEESIEAICRLRVNSGCRRIRQQRQLLGVERMNSRKADPGRIDREIRIVGDR